jgi:dephospho-CoA kinase
LAHESKPTREPRAGLAATTTRVWAVLGGIASGKSALARMLAGPDGVVIDADELVSELYSDPRFCERVAAAFGAEVLSESRRIDRAALARRVFADPQARRTLESWIHPPVREAIRARLDAARRRGAGRVVLDVPLLLEHEAEHRLPDECDALIFVDAPLVERDARAVRSRGWSPGEVARREAQQLPLAIKRARAQHVIVNDGTPAQLELEVRKLLRDLQPPPT